MAEKQLKLFSRTIYKCTPMARKLAVYSMKQLIQNKNSAVFSISEFLDAVGMTKSKPNYESTKNAVIECLKLQLVLSDTDECFKAYNWFSYVLYDQESNKIKMQFSQHIAKMIKDRKDFAYSYINLDVIGNLKNVYSTLWYELSLAYCNLKDSTGCWSFRITVEKIKQLFQLNDDFSHFVERVIKNPIESLNDVNPLFEITIEKEWYGQGKKIVAVILHCQEKKSDTLEVASEKERIENIKSMHMLEYIDLLKAEYEKTNSSSFAENNAISILLEKYKDE